MGNTIYDERNNKLKEVNKKIQKVLGGELRKQGKNARSFQAVLGCRGHPGLPSAKGLHQADEQSCPLVHLF